MDVDESSSDERDSGSETDEEEPLLPWELILALMETLERLGLKLTF